MIQRIQSLYLLITTILGLLIFCFYIPTLYKILSYFSISGLSVTTIFLFKKRSLQIKLCGLLILLCTIELVLFSFFYLERVEFVIMIIPIVQAIFIFLALRAIKKDEELVRSVDRLR